MVDHERKQVTAVTIAGTVAVLVTLLLCGMGMMLAIRQTQSLVLHRINDLRAEAELIHDNVTQSTVAPLERLLQGVATALRRRHDVDPFTLAAPPLWVDRIYLFDQDTDVTLQTWRRDDRGGWTRTVSYAGTQQPGDAEDGIIMARSLPAYLAADFDPRTERLQFIHDQYEGRPEVFAHVTDLNGLHGHTVVAGRIDVEAFIDAVVGSALGPAASRIAVEIADGARREAEWKESLVPVTPDIQLVPTRRFIEQQYSVVRRQTMLFVAATLLAVVALLVVMWGMWRVFKREIALSKLKQSFVADVSHELKTPLALIRLFGETLSSGRVPTEEKRREYYEIITRESDRLTHLINNILDFSRIDAGKKRYKMQPTDVGELVRETYEAYQLPLDHDGFEHQLLVDAELPRINCDRDAVAQAFINLINNAMKYAEDDKFLGIDVSRETRRGQHGVLISVSDRGIGIRPEDRNNLFLDFYRSNDTRVRQRRGAGLGLALVKHIVDAHHGIVDVESRLVKGSTFRIFLPARDGIDSGQEIQDGTDSDRRG